MKTLNLTLAGFLCTILLPAISLAQDPGACEEVCKVGASTPRCMKLSKKDARGHAFNALYDKLTTSTEPIPPSWLMSTFEVFEDPCARGATTAVGDTWSNQGGACQVRAEVSIFRNAKIRVAIDIPPRLAYKVVKSPNGHIFNPASPFATVAFEDEDLNKDWGGGILKIIGNSDSVQLQLPKGCIQIPFK